MNPRMVFLLALTALQGCATGMERLQARLAAQLQETKGQSLHQARMPKGVIEHRDPTELRMLSNGHILQVYHNYWSSPKPCDVFLEVNPKGQIIVNAYAKGSGCFASH